VNGPIGQGTDFLASLVVGAAPCLALTVRET
jgi:hypothetical protein